MVVGALWLFFVVPWVGLQCVIVVFPDRSVSLVFVVLSTGQVLAGFNKA